MSTDETFDQQTAAIPRVGDDPLQLTDASLRLPDTNNTAGGDRMLESEQMHLTGVDINDVDIANLHVIAAAANDDTDDEDDDDGGRVQLGEDGDLEFENSNSRQQQQQRGGKHRRGVMFDLGDGETGAVGTDDGGAAVTVESESEPEDDDDEHHDVDDDDEDALGDDEAAGERNRGEDDDDDDDDAREERSVKKDKSSKKSKKKAAAAAAAAAAVAKPVAEPWRPVFPEATLKKLLQVACPAPATFTRDALRAVNRSVELILQDLAQLCARECQRRHVKQLSYDLLAEVIARNDRFSFLADVVPLATMGRLVQVAAAKKPAAKKSTTTTTTTTSANTQQHKSGGAAQFFFGNAGGGGGGGGGGAVSNASVPASDAAE